MSATNVERQRLDFIDVARGGAAIVVLLEHALHACFPAYKTFSESYFMLGEVAIFVFFMISGFVIPMSLEEGRGVANFWTRRFFRLMPIYWLSLALAFICLPLGLPGPSNVSAGDWKSWLANVFLLQERLDRPAVLGVYWSLHYELGLYVVFSILAGCKLLGRIGVWAFVSFLVFRAIPFSSLSRGTPAVLTYHQAILLAVAFGFLAYRFVSGRFSRTVFYSLTAGVFAVLLVRWTANRLYFPTAQSFDVLLRWTMTLGLACGAFIFLLEAPPHWMPRIGCWLGRRSYPIYLLHPMAESFLWVLNWPSWAYLLGSVILAIAFADIAHRLVERPAINFGRWLERRSTATVAKSRVELKRAA